LPPPADAATLPFELRPAAAYATLTPLRRLCRQRHYASLFRRYSFSRHYAIFRLLIIIVQLLLPRC